LIEKEIFRQNPLVVKDKPFFQTILNDFENKLHEFELANNR